MGVKIPFVSGWFELFKNISSRNGKSYFSKIKCGKIYKYKNRVEIIVDCQDIWLSINKFNLFVIM